MSRPFFLGALAVAACGIAVGWRVAPWSAPDTFSDPAVAPPEAAPLCPWREPQADLQRFFPGATRYEVETRILSGLRPELAGRLGRAATGDENALRTAQVYRGQNLEGSILTRRVKGENGAIELVLALDTNLCVRGVRVQRMREPAPVARALQDTHWLGAFTGKRADDPWELGRDVAPVPAEARTSAEALVQGLRSLQILATTAEAGAGARLVANHHR